MENKMKLIYRFLIATALILLMASNGLADTHTISSNCTASAVQNVIDAVDPGDTIDVTCTGTVTWSAAVTLSGGKTLKGGGEKGSSGTDGTWPLTINVTSSGDAAVIIINDDSEAVNRLTGFKFQGTGSPTYVVHSYGKGTGTDGKGAFRIDNNYFYRVSFGSRVILTDGDTGKLTGLIDNNVFDFLPATEALSKYENTYKGSSDTCYGYDSESRANAGFGSDDFVFWEDNYMFNHGFDNVDGGGRIVLRYNEIASNITSTTFDVIDGHGAGSTGTQSVGTVRHEVYKNTITGDSAFSHIANIRGGEWMVYNNTAPLSGILQLEEYRLSTPSALEWKACSGDHCCPTTPAQCNIETPDADDFASCYPLLNQVQNTFIWNNIQDGENMTPQPSTTDVETYIALNRDYWMPSYGTEANLPASCTTGDYYGATDSGKLWECTATSTWTLQYTPYTYPHPLQGAADENAPTATWGIDSTGLIATGAFSESVNATTKTGVSFTGSTTGAITATYKDGMPGGIIRYDLNKEVQQSETVVINYTTPGDGIKDLAGNALADISDGAVTNGSTQGTPPLVALTIGAHTGALVSVSPGINCGSTCGPVDYDNGTVLTLNVQALRNYTGCTIGGTGCAASTTMSEARTCTVTCTKISPDVTIGSGAAVTLGTGASGTLY
jgi:hypothetical protein